MHFVEFSSDTQAHADAFYADALAHGFDAEAVFHSTPQTDGRAALNNSEFYTVSVYMAESVPENMWVLLDAIAEKHNMDDEGAEPSTSFDDGERPGSEAAHA